MEVTRNNAAAMAAVTYRNNAYDVNVRAEREEKPKEQGKEEEGTTAPVSALTAANNPEVRELQARDIEVRAHESAHLSAGGGVVTGGASFSYQRGPDGKLYAIGGEVPIDAGEGTTPDETISKAQRIRTAALAPADPSPQDYKVAAMATVMEQNARVERMRELQSQIEGRRAYRENGLSIAGPLMPESAVNAPAANGEVLAS